MYFNIKVNCKFDIWNILYIDEKVTLKPSL